MFAKELTFAFFDDYAGWRSDFTMRFCEYFAFKFHENHFQNFILSPKSIDDAIAKCQTKYLFIFRSGFIPHNKTFFADIYKQLERNEDIFLGNIFLVDDYAVLAPNFLVINIQKLAGVSARFISQEYEKLACLFDVDEAGIDRDYPKSIKTVYSEPNNPTKIRIERSCHENGASLISKQLELHGVARSVSSVTSHYSVLDDSTSFAEIISETRFEKLHLQPRLNTVRLSDDDFYSDLPNISSCDTIITVAKGLRPHTLAQQYKPQNMLILCANEGEKILQQNIFSNKSHVYDGAITAAQDAAPSFIYETIPDRDRYSIITPIKCTIDYVIVDPFSFNLFEAVRAVDHKGPKIFDFADIFIDPYNFYKRPLYQVQGLFSVVFSDIRSRTGLSRILGYAPGFARLNTTDINAGSNTFLSPMGSGRVKSKATSFVPPANEQIKEPLIKKTIFQKVKDVVLPSEPVSSAPKSWRQVALDDGWQFDASISENNTVLSKSIVVDGNRLLMIYDICDNPWNWKFKLARVGRTKQIIVANGSSQTDFQSHLEKDTKMTSSDIAQL